ncbi:MAG TPA: glycoside hydrolase family 2 TIM barrel-domain containing protein [Vicinamibacteria bacterium]|nr:glycoside hydrolase family 2 TIM barrel-domain containing protein [Vicinamibacteria bacterium]
MRRSLCALALLLSGCHASQEAAPGPGAPPTRAQVQLHEGWRFRAAAGLAGAEAPSYDDAGWAAVSIPHTWAKQDPRTHRAAWYRTRFRLEAADLAGRVYLYFEGVAVVADVYVNGTHLGQHRGAYTRFVFDATGSAREGENLLALRVSNDPQDTADCLPSGASKRQLYRVWGGVHRMVHLLKTGSLHVDPTDHAAPGVFVTPRDVSAEGASLEARVLVRNAAPQGARYEVRGRLLDPGGREALVLRARDEAGPNERREVALAGRVAKPRLWAPGAPDLYRFEVELLRDGAMADSVVQEIGFRDFRADGQGFFLNGRPILLRGVSKHQMSERNLAAVSDDDIRADFEALAELGVNAIRLAHYPHSDLAYSLADRKGILVIAENGHTTTESAGTTGETITREMVLQNYNHPSIVAWSVGNEAGYVKVFRYARLVRESDPLRAITYASNTGVLRRKQDDLSFVMHNRYPGWYATSPWDFEFKALDMRFISEAGGGAVVSNHTDYAKARHVVDAFEPEEYRQVLAEVQTQVVFRRQPGKVPLYLTWVLRDFPIDKYKGVLNTKGLLTGGGLRKDAFFLYKAFLRPDTPVVHVTSQTYFLRRGDPANGVKAYSNRPALTLFVNGEARGTLRNGEFRQGGTGTRIDNVFYWRTPLRIGRNELLLADGEGNEDRAVVYAAPGGAAWPDEPGAPIRRLTSSNPGNRAYFINAPAREQWPFYYDLDGTADNTFDALPEVVRGASWIATRRLSKPENRTELRFEAAASARVLVLRSSGGPKPAALLEAGFAASDARGEWRDDGLRLVPFEVFARDVAPGDRVRIPAETRDYVVLVK